MITVTEKAAGEVKRAMSEANLPADTVLRIGVAGGGCSGFSYKLGFDNSASVTSDKDHVSEQHGLKVAVDKKSDLYLDGTTIDHSGALSAAVRGAVADVVAAGHHLVISTGRSIVATLPVVAMLGVDRGYAVCSNGAVTLVLDPGEERGYRVVDTVTFDPRPVLTMLREEIPDALVAVEDLGVGFKVSAPFPDGELGGDYLYGGDGSDWLLGREGRDQFAGGSGEDTIDAATDDDGQGESVAGGADDDLIFADDGGAAADTVTGDAGFDTCPADVVDVVACEA